MLIPAEAIILENGRLKGENITRTIRRLKDLQGVFMDESAYQAMDPEQVVYEVETHNECGHSEGGLFFGNCVVSPGKVGREYFMTKGHVHEKLNRGEYYWGISGQGVLVMMDANKSVRTVKIEPGSLHFVAGETAHRIANTGGSELIVGACWPADAGHDYTLLAAGGFPVRIVEKDQQPTVQASL
jgi:glucose-6-phosphate isomerase